MIKLSTIFAIAALGLATSAQAQEDIVKQYCDRLGELAATAMTLRMEGQELAEVSAFVREEFAEDEVPEELLNSITKIAFLLPPMPEGETRDMFIQKYSGIVEASCLEDAQRN